MSQVAVSEKSMTLTLIEGIVSAKALGQGSARGGEGQQVSSAAGAQGARGKRIVREKFVVAGVKL